MSFGNARFIRWKSPHGSGTFSQKNSIHSLSKKLKNPKTTAHPLRNHPSARTPSEKGFALVVTLSLMILLTVIAVGLLTLSSISLRSSTQGQAMAVAQANARLALTLAIGDLQKSLGCDQRVTAAAEILPTAKAATPGPCQRASRSPRSSSLGTALRRRRPGPGHWQVRLIFCLLLGRSPGQLGP